MKVPILTRKIDVARAEYWISKGAQPSDTVRSLLKKNRKRATTETSVAAPQPSA